ncbi:hypothetical protein [Rhizobium skierniewicense]|uniref:hypothetical protein n=1 Tax=Rhizobium skierniewicense TaxID=984260 RepID=UPI0015716599|nr:hypothetical protein [Rhizobium skierniewicense]NTF32303.1 hypothetical protein [Rhizobium skierniewicense]
MKLEMSSKDMEQLQRAFQRLPGEIQSKAMRRAMTRLSQTARTRIVARLGPHTQMPRELVAALTTAHFNAGGNTAKVVAESGWIPLQRLGAVQNASGVYARLRGSYRHAFVAAMKSGHVGAFRRVPGTQMSSSTGKREQIRELFAANPAHAITNNPDVYLDVLAGVIEDYFFPRLVHEIDRLLPR